MARIIRVTLTKEFYHKSIENLCLMLSYMKITNVFNGSDSQLSDLSINCMLFIQFISNCN